MSNTEITGETLAEHSLPRLLFLELADTQLSEPGLKRILKLPIRSLDLSGVSLRKLPVQEGCRITYLSIHANSPVFAALPRHSIASSLQRLKLTGAGVEDLDTIAQLDSVVFLILVDCSLGANSFERISSHPTLSAIHLKNCQLTPDAIKELGQIKHLTIVRSSSQLDQLQELKVSRPELQIENTDRWEDY